MDVDWAFEDEGFYQQMVAEAVVTTGLDVTLGVARTWNELLNEGFDARILGFLLVVLKNWKCVVEDDGLWRWVGGAVDPRPLLRVRQIRQWSGLVERLRPGGDDERRWTPYELAWLEVGCRRLVDWLVPQVGVCEGERWLDVGAGHGALGWALADAGASVTLVDLPDVAGHWSERSHPRINGWTGDIFLGFPAGLFEGILLARFIESFSDDKISQLLTRCGQHLSAAGRIVVAGYFTGLSPGAELFGMHVALAERTGRVFSVERLARLALSAGLRTAAVRADATTGYGAVFLVPRLLPPNKRG